MSASDHLHPQQFSEWFHGTKKEKAESIGRTGLTASSYGVYKNRTGKDEHHFVLTNNKNEAADYSGHRGSVVTVRVPNSEASNYLTLPSWKRTGLQQPIPPNMIHKVEHNLGREYD